MKITLIVLVIVVVLLVIVWAFFGGFRKIKIAVAEQGGETVVYESITGDYRQSGAVMDKVYSSLLNKYEIETYKGFGQYYDNPKLVDKNKLRSEAGCIIEPKDVQKLAQIDIPFRVKTIPVKKYMITEFPYKGKLSVMVGIFKVYPALEKFTMQNNHSIDGSIIEIYDVPGKKIMYRKEISF
jgi:effector-binding domain-containing protein